MANKAASMHCNWTACGYDRAIGTKTDIASVVTCKVCRRQATSYLRGMAAIYDEDADKFRTELAEWDSPPQSDDTRPQPRRLKARKR